MRRTKQMQNMIDMVNTYLRRNGIKDEGNDLFLVVTHNLLQQGLYRGFNYYKDKEIGGDIYPVLAGSDVNFEYLQIL